jgi:hypothetical protein
MKRLVPLLFITATLCAAPPQERKLGMTPVVVELFTSQGCSSCPPADALLRELARDASLRGRVIPLAYHVDYWNRLGWSDPFSSADWSRRQMFYVRQLRADSAYTPQAVVGGREQFVGSNRAQLDAALARASAQPPAGALRVTQATNGNALNVSVHADVAQSGKWDVMVAVVEDELTTRVAAGENGGRTFTEDAVVRKLERAGSVAVGGFDKMLTIPLEPAWKRDRVHVVAFLQDHATLAIGGAAAAR